MWPSFTIRRHPRPTFFKWHPLSLNVPEILELIFPYLDASTLCHTVCLVSRQWLQMNQDRVTREVVWDYCWKDPKLFSTLPRVVGAERIRCIVEGDEPDDVFNKPVQKLMKDYQYHYHNGVRRQQPQQSMYGSRRQVTQWVFERPLKEMSLTLCLFSPEEFNKFPYSPTLTTLKIEMGHSTKILFNLGTILEALPFLEHFHGLKGEGWHLSGPWISQNHDRRKPLRLKTLDIYYASFWQEDLGDLLTITPDLKVLKPVGVTTSHFAPSSLREGEDITYNRRQLFQHLKTLSFTPSTFHFSISSYSPDDDGNDDERFNQMARELCPGLSEWSLWSPVVTPTLLRELQTLRNVVTRLELSWADEIMQIQDMIGGMDLHRRASFRSLSFHDDYAWTGSQSQESIRPGIWACRKLRVLEMEVRDHNGGEVQVVLPVLSQILFGYLSRVCPKLEKIDIRVPWYCSGSMHGPSYSPGLCTQLYGGLCFLSRLTELRMLRVCPNSLAEGYNANRIDFAWMTPGGNTEKERRKRRVMMAGWKGMLAQEELLEDDRLQSSAVREPLLVSETVPVEPEIFELLKDLGRLSEVKAVLEGMDKEGFRCLQQLTHFSLGPTLGQRPQDVLKRLFPQKFLHIK
ncbi:hypothetical protein BG015_007031 [Linnemannia schmuckeri]|uniref:F-box domain-containing protein n=1 Tax=Linnemannia schmuckeri TaxID=64567 RepID=A0A9P5RZ26_9FUNG|nr:hypothetical protein BG015_007031 [Linnemannia schmuckeri]